MYLNLNAEMARNKITQIDMAKALNISTSTLSEKMTGKKDFKLKECKTIIKTLLPNNTMDYLFKIEDEEEGG